MDFEIGIEEQEVVDGFRKVVRGFTWNEGQFVASLDAVPREDTSRAISDLVAAGWSDLAVSGVSINCLLASIEAASEVVVPTPLPILEVWLGSLVLEAAGGDADSSGASLISPDAVLRPLETGHGTGDDREISTGRLPSIVAGAVLTLEHSDQGAVVMTAGVERLVSEPLHAVDLSRTPVEFRGAAHRWEEVGIVDQEELARLQAITLLLMGATQLGQARALFDKTVEYLKQRIAFGVPIGSFQALKHRAADTYVELHAAELLLRTVGWCLKEVADPRPLAHLSRASAASASMAAAQEAVQLHGGIGYTWEGAIHFGVRRCAELSMLGVSVAESWAAAGAAALQGKGPLWPIDVIG